MLRSARSGKRTRPIPGNLAWVGRRACCNELLQFACVPRAEISLTYDEAMAICLLLAEAADAAADEEQVRDTWVGEARLMIELILGRTDE